MARPKEVVDRDLVRKAQVVLEEISDNQICVRLQAIISSGDHPMSLVADIMGVHPTTVWRWSKRFKENGVDGLRDRPKGHNPSKLGSEHRRIIFEWLNKSENAEGDCVHWTIPLLKEEVQRVFGIGMGKTPLWLMVRKLGFRQKVPRPHHAKADREEQEVFKKNG